jgi:hypothetical protein
VRVSYPANLSVCVVPPAAGRLQALLQVANSRAVARRRFWLQLTPALETLYLEA